MSEWKKVKIGDVCKIVKGTTGIASAVPGEFPLVVTAVERKTCSTYQFDCEAVCIPLVSSSGHGKKSLNNVHFQSGKFALGTILCAVIPNNPDELDARYLHQYLQFYKDTVLVPLMKGAANVSLSMKDIAGVEVPLPPIKKQCELSAMFVSLQEKSLEFKKETDKQVEYVKLLRQNILQEAIEGKLTAAWRKQHPVQKGDPDYDAEALFEQIQNEKYHTDLFAPNGAHAKKAKSVSSEPIRVTRKEKSLPPITEDEIPFEIPTGWKWVRLGEIVENITSGSREWAKYYSDTGAIFLRMGNLSRESYELRLDNIQHVRVPESSEGKRTRLLPFDLLFSITAEIGNLGLIPKDFPEAYINQHTARIRFAQLVKQSLYFANALLAPGIRKLYLPNAHGMKNSFRLDTLSFIPIPLPPLAEQKEIVARVEKHLQTITQLETQIATRESLTKQLMQGLLKDTFAER